MKLEKIIKQYFEASNNYNEEELKKCFTSNAILFDEGRQYSGNGTIAKHIQQANNQNVKVKVLQVRTEGVKTTVSGEVTGPFDPILLDFIFTLSNGLISELAITNTK